MGLCAQLLLTGMELFRPLLSSLLCLMDQFVGQASWSRWSLYNSHIWVLQENVFSGVHFSEPMFFSSIVPFGKVL